jgi:hypothetical protein
MTLNDTVLYCTVKHRSLDIDLQFSDMPFALCLN